MAMENYVLLVGKLEQSPIFFSNNKVKFSIKTIRRNNREDYPIITNFNEDVINKIKEITVGDIVLVKGIISTKEVIKSFNCPFCNKLIKQNGTTTEIVAIDVVKMINKDISYYKEISNNVTLLGSLCQEPNVRVLAKTNTVSTQYQLAINRKLNLSSRGNNKTTDYPWVNSFGIQAEKDAKVLKTSSQVFINGGVQTRTVNKKIICPDCNNHFKVEDNVAEIVPYSVEYLNNCNVERLE